MPRSSLPQQSGKTCPFSILCLLFFLSPLAIDLAFRLILGGVPSIFTIAIVIAVVFIVDPLNKSVHLGGCYYTCGTCLQIPCFRFRLLSHRGHNHVLRLLIGLGEVSLSAVCHTALKAFFVRGSEPVAWKVMGGVVLVGRLNHCSTLCRLVSKDVGFTGC